MRARCSAPALRAAAAALAAAGVLLLVPTRAAEPKFFDDDPLMHEVATQDASNVTRYEPTLFWDVVSNSFGPQGDPDLTKRAGNVNTIDEVPDGAWFVNRAGREPLTPEQVARGSNTGGGPAPGPWTVTAAKTDGITPGFTIRDSAGTTWFIKFDPPGHRGMATGIEVTIAKLFWALGYHTVEYYLADLDPSQLAIGEGTTFTPPAGRPRHMHRGDIDWLLSQADRDPRGTYRVIASKAAPGRPVGRVSFTGTRTDDPNDIVPHEHRRELRGYGVFAAWFNHVDAKSGNTLDVLVKNDEGRTTVRHYLLDFGSTMGSAAVGPREYWEGSDFLIDLGRTGRRIPSFGFYIEPWRTVALYESPAVGRLIKDNTAWDPETWKPRVPNPAFIHARADDKFWAARKAMAITDDLLRAAVREGQFGSEADEAFLVKALGDRRDAILRRYLPAVNPVVDPVLDAGGLQFRNAAVDASVAQPPSAYKAAWSRFDNATGAATPIGETTGAGTTLAAPGLPPQAGAVVQVAISATSSGHPEWAAPVHAYFRRTAGGWKLVGFERMPDGRR